MTEERVIIVPLDGSEFAEWALPPAIVLAEDLQARIEIVSVPQGDEPPNDGALVVGTDAEKWLEEYLTDVVRRVKASTAVPVAAEIHSGSVGEQICAQADEHHALFVVMSTHGRGPLSRAWLGSVADHVVRHASAPVWLIRPPAEGRADLNLRPHFRKIVIAVDGSARAEKSFDWVRRIGKAEGATYTLLQVVTSLLPAPSPDFPVLAGQREGLIKLAEEEANEYLAAASARLGAGSLNVRTELLVDVPVARSITSFAKENAAELIALTTHGRGGLARAVMGSVADKVVRAAPCPVLVCRGAN